MNTKLLRKIQTHILEEPNRLAMRAFVYRGDDWGGTFLADNEKVRIPFAECGAAACIGGWAVLLTHGMNWPLGNIRQEATEALGLKVGKEDRLFEVRRWPKKFSTAYRRARSQNGRAKIAAKRIDHFIRTKGAQ